MPGLAAEARTRPERGQWHEETGATVDSGRRPPARGRGSAARRGGRCERRPLSPATQQSPPAPRVPAAPDWLQGGGRGRGSALPQRTPPPPNARSRLPPSPARSRPLTPHRRRRKRAHLDRGRGAAGAGARRAASLAAVAGRGVAGKAPFSGAARACSPGVPQPLSACQSPTPSPLRAAAGHAQRGFPARVPAWRDAAGVCSRRERRGRRTDTRSQEAGGPSVRPGGGVRRRLEGAGAVEWTAPLLLAWGLLSTSGPWSEDREVGAAAEGDAR